MFVCVEFIHSSIVLYLFCSKGVSSLQATLPYCHTYCLWKGRQREGNSVLMHLNAFTLKFRHPPYLGATGLTKETRVTRPDLSLVLEYPDVLKEKSEEEGFYFIAGPDWVCPLRMRTAH